METLRIEEALKLLKEGALLTQNNRRYFFYDGKGIICLQNGSRFFLSEEDFKELYQKEILSLAQENNFEVDHLKDEEYYQRYRK